MGRSSLEWLCFFIAVVRRGSSLAAHLHISHAKDIFLAPVYDRFTEGFCDCGHADRASRARLAPAASSVTLICWRRPCARNSPWHYLPAPNQGDSPVAADRRSRAVEHEASGQRRTTCPMREFLLRTLSGLSDALVSAQGREDWIPPAILDHDRFRQAPMPADR